MANLHTLTPGDTEPNIVHGHAPHRVAVGPEAPNGVPREAHDVHVSPNRAEDNGVLLDGDRADLVIANDVRYLALQKDSIIHRTHGRWSIRQLYLQPMVLHDVSEFRVLRTPCHG